jgi:glyoxylase-like metal-dependent hydrolase (beta-lactamase superfamily II)
MEMKQVSDNCFAALNENPVSEANSGLINLAGGVVIDTQSDLAHARRMIELFMRVWPAMPGRVINTHEDSAHVWGNQLFQGSEIIAHRSVPDRMLQMIGPNHSTTLVPATTLFDARYEFDLDGTAVHLIYVGPCHQVGDLIVHVPKERVVFAGDVLFRHCTPTGWTGSYDKWFKCLDLIQELDPEAIVPGHGPLCGLEGVAEMRAYLEYVRDESKRHFDAGLSSLAAATRIEFGPYGEWRAPARLFMNVERAYREFRNEPADAAWNTAALFDAIHKVATARGISVEF